MSKSKIVNFYIVLPAIISSFSNNALELICNFSPPISVNFSGLPNGHLSGPLAKLQLPAINSSSLECTMKTLRVFR